VAGSVGIDPHLAVRVAFHESGLNPNALNPTTGAVGIMQLMPATAATLGVNPHDIMENVRGGVRYLGNQLERFGDPAQALAAYNWGPEHVAQAVLRWGADWLSHAPGETRRYVNAILSGSKPGAVVPASTGHSAVQLVSRHERAPTDSSLAQARFREQRAKSLNSVLDAYLLSAILSD